MNKELKPKWREEFKKKFPVDSFYGLILSEENEIESFIEAILSKTIQAERLEVLERIDEYDKERIGRYWQDKNNAKSSNEVVLDIINLINKTNE